jgi:UDP-N-acetylglucosamine transferase subunit ALG13
MKQLPVRILVTVGTQFSFNRLINMVDEWAAANKQLQEAILMQVGPDGDFPAFARGVEFLSPEEYQAASATAELIVAHAGIGSILTAIDLGLPVVIFPRSFELGEHRNNHQDSTAREFSSRKGVYVATTLKHLHELLDKRGSLETPDNGEIDKEIANRVESFIRGSA